MLKKIALLLLLIVPMSVFAQKFGHLKSADVLTVMPEFTKAQTDIQAMQKQYEDEMKRATDELTKKQEALIAPIQDKIYEAVKQISEQKGYAAVVDRGSAQSIIFASPSIDISNEVLSRLGYSN